MEIIDLKKFGDDRGTLIPIEKGSNSPFEVKRVFYVYGTKPSKPRGAHANKNSEFLLIALNGSCKVKADNGKEQKIFELNSSDKALYLEKMTWKEMFDFSKDCVLLVLSSEHYDANEYIKDYDEFIKVSNS